MKENKLLIDLLKELENDNVSLLSADISAHKLSKAFNRRALAICRGENVPVSAPSVYKKRLPLWAAVLIALLIVTTITGCAVAVYYHFFKYIPYYGIVYLDSNTVMYSSSETIQMHGIEIETVLYVRSEEESARLMMWAVSDTDHAIGSKVLEIELNGKNYDLLCTGYEGMENGRLLITAEADCIAVNEIQSSSITCKNTTKEITLSDISEKGYGVSPWAEINGITIKVLPLYGNNRIFIASTNGLNNASAIVSIKVYDSKGNSTTSSGGSIGDDNNYIFTCNDRLPGDITKIEITGLRIHQSINTQKFTLPLSEEKTELEIPLFSNNDFTETAVLIEKRNEFYYLTTETVISETSVITDIYCDYMVENGMLMEYNIFQNGKGQFQTVYKLRIPEGENYLNLELEQYIYSITSDMPLAEITVKKEK